MVQNHQDQAHSRDPRRRSPYDGERGCVCVYESSSLRDDQEEGVVDQDGAWRVASQVRTAATGVNSRADSLSVQYLIGLRSVAAARPADI